MQTLLNVERIREVLREMQTMWNVEKNMKCVLRSAIHVNCRKEYAICKEKCKLCEMLKRIRDVSREVQIMWNVKKNMKYVKRSAMHVKCKKEYEIC